MVALEPRPPRGSQLVTPWEEEEEPRRWWRWSSAHRVVVSW